MISVVVVDDHTMVAEGLRRLVDQATGFEVAAVLTSGDELLTHLSSSPLPDVCTLDLVMPGTSGLELLRQLAEDFPTIAVLVCSANASAEIAVRCLRAGATGFISKFRAGGDFVAALQRVAAGQRYIDDDLLSDVLSRLTSPQSDGAPHESLSPREFAVMEALAQGRSIKEIAVGMYLSPKTVSTYRARVLAKLEFTSNAEITAYALRHGLVELHSV